MKKIIAGMVELTRLDEADVRHDRCPVCKNNQLNKIDGIKICPRCDTEFKIFDGRAYIINKQDVKCEMENRVIARLKKLANEENLSDITAIIEATDLDALAEKLWANDNLEIDASVFEWTPESSGKYKWCTITPSVEDAFLAAVENKKDSKLQEMLNNILLSSNISKKVNIGELPDDSVSLLESAYDNYEFPEAKAAAQAGYNIALEDADEEGYGASEPDLYDGY